MTSVAAVGSSLLGIDLGLPIVAAPMAGGPSTPALVTAVGRAGGIGFLAAGYKQPSELATQIDELRAEGVEFGVNLFVPNPVPVDPGAYATYARSIQIDADAVGIDLSEVVIIEDDDHWEAKLDLLVEQPVPIVSFTFGLAPDAAIRRLRRAGSALAQTVTSVDEAMAATEAGIDALVVQASAAGAHSGTWTPERIPVAVSLDELLQAIRACDVVTAARRRRARHACGGGRRPRCRGVGGDGRHRPASVRRERSFGDVQGCARRPLAHADGGDARLHRPAGASASQCLRRPSLGVGAVRLPGRPSLDAPGAGGGDSSRGSRADQHLGRHRSSPDRRRTGRRDRQLAGISEHMKYSCPYISSSIVLGNSWGSIGYCER